MSTKLARPSDLAKINLLHPALKAVLLKFADMGGKFIVIETERGKAAQEKAFNTGHSKAHFGQSPHDYNPALGVDIGPVKYPGVLGDYHTLAIGMYAAAKELNVDITWGGEWKSIKDWPHFQLTNWKELKGILAS